MSNVTEHIGPVPAPISGEPSMRASSELAEVPRAWVLTLLALLSVAVGVVVLANPSISLATLAVLSGIYLLVTGLCELGLSLTNRHENRALIAVFGVTTTIAGVLLIRHPTHAVTVIAILVGLWLLVSGLVRLVRVFGEPGPRLWVALWAVLELLAGIVIVSTPRIGVATLALILGISLIARGVAIGVVAWTVWAVGRLDREAEGAGAPG